MNDFGRVLPYLQVATAVAPLAAAVFVRLVSGANRFTGLLLSLATIWFAVNVLFAPFTGLTRLGEWLR